MRRWPRRPPPTFPTGRSVSMPGWPGPSRARGRATRPAWRKPSSPGTTMPPSTGGPASTGCYGAPCSWKDCSVRVALEDAAVALEQLRAQSEGVVFLRPALAWLSGWLEEVPGLAPGRPTHLRAGCTTRSGLPALRGSALVRVRPASSPPGGAHRRGRAADPGQLLLPAGRSHAHSSGRASRNWPIAVWSRDAHAGGAANDEPGG